ncbi:MAG: glutamate formimidoyltransferase [Limnochordales bacterium]|nr:glutamate formimidoyltransferase [Limnochordales bacterium]
MGVRPWIECVPNFSEGRRPEVVARIAAAAEGIAGAALLGAEADPDHNRAVLTIAGEPEAVLEAVWQACRVAVAHIDLRSHEGVHPRIGAVDVVPFVPGPGVSIADCLQLAERFGQRLWQELGIPVYLYGRAARRPERRRLATIRRGGFEALQTEITMPDRAPDIGEARLHPSAGATAVGVRPPLVAFNVLLRTADLTIARKIARNVRETGGGLVNIQAMGFPLASQGLVQVSLNLLDPVRTPIYRVLELIRTEAARYGVSVARTELVGLLPLRALLASAAYYLGLERLQPEEILEWNIVHRLGKESTELKWRWPDGIGNPGT